MINLPIGYFHECLLAVHDLLHADSVLAECFGAVALAGTVSVTAGTVGVTGTGTDFERDLSEGDRVELEGQVSYVETISGPLNLDLAVPHVEGALGATMSRAAQIFVQDFPLAPPIGPPFGIVSGGPIQPLEAGVGERTLDPVVWVHYLAEIRQRPLTDAAPNLWDVGDRMARVLTDPGVAAIRPPAALLCVPRMGNVQLTNGVTSAGQGISELEVEASDPAQFLAAPGWSFAYRSISNPLDIASANQPLW